MRYLLSLIFLLSMLFAVDQQAILQMIKNNPSLLNSPQAKRLLKESQRKSDFYKESKTLDTEAINEIKIEDFSDENQTLMQQEQNVTERNISKIFSPLRYLTQEELIEKVRKLRQEEEKRPLKRYCERFFYNKNKINTKLLAVPDYYELNVGDRVRIQIFGGEEKEYLLQVDRSGNISLPVIGPLYVAGLSVAELKELLIAKLAPTYQNAKIVVNVDIGSMIQVTLAGFAKAPGVYNLDGLSTIKDLLIIAKGIDPAGSIRQVYLKRNGRVLKIVDFYRLLQKGDVVDRTILKNGDIVYIPRAKKLVELDGSVYHPAIFELLPGERLEDLVRFSGGILPQGSKKHIKITRYMDEKEKIYFTDFGKRFRLLNGDRVYVYKISEVNKDFVYIYGNVDKPGSYALPKDRKLATLLKRVEFLKDTYYDYAIIEHEDESITSFSIKNPKDITLKPKDLIYIFNRYEIEPVYYITLKGDVLNAPGKYRYLKGETLKDAINNAGGVKTFFDMKRVQIVRFDEQMQPHIFFVDYDKNPDFPLQPFDEITLFNYQNFNPVRPVNVYGEVHYPGTFIYAKDMKLKDALLAAGWFKDSADREHIEIVRFKVIDGKRERKILQVSSDALETPLEPYDTIMVKKIPQWNEIKRVTIEGEVRYPGTYIINTGDRLADVIERAGGFTKDAYLYGAVFTRKSVKKLKEKRLNDMIYKLKRTVTIIAASAKGAGERSLDAQQLISAIDSLAKDAQKLKPIGRIALVLDADLEKLRKSPYNIPLENGDKLYIPAKKNSVIVMGEVLTESAFVYDSKYAIDYIKKAGGVTDNAGERYFVVHANGFTERGEFGGWLAKDVKVKPGDAIVVPLHIKTATWYGIAKDISSIVYQLAVTAASLKTVGAL